MCVGLVPVSGCAVDRYGSKEVSMSLINVKIELAALSLIMCM